MLPYLPPYPAAEGVSARIAFILHAAMVYVASRVRQAVPGQGPAIIPVRFERLINLWLEARKRAIVALIGRIEAGTQPPPRPYKARETKTTTAKPGAARKGPGPRLPTRFGWLCVIGREVGGPGSWLARLLDEDMRDMVTAHPHLARLIRPVLRMMGQRSPQWFPKPANRARSKRTAAAARGREQPAGDARADETSRELDRFIAAEGARQYAEAMATLYAGCAGGPPPEVAKRLARQAAPRPAPVPAATAPPPEATIDRDRYYYAETWNGKLIPVRRRWGW
jgi:pyruvate/2-oxoglutarate dehydrogenase complex dihydrolipoamide acyltransferase (E2) component